MRGYAKNANFIFNFNINYNVKWRKAASGGATSKGEGSARSEIVFRAHCRKDGYTVTLQEVGQIMDILAAIYPAFYSKQSDAERYNAASLWASLFEPYPVELVAAAVKSFIASDTKGFPPVPGQIMEKVRLLTQPQEMGEAEAWALVKRACSNGIYGAQAEFDALPLPIRQIVGSPSQLREWAMVDGGEFNTVVASNFQRAYRVHAQRERDYMALPPDIRELADSLSRRTALEEAKE